VRYEFTPEHPVVVEIYPRADDFAVRTFGIPDVSGFLGVCFGKVITANSPATRRDQPTSWESILWHEFCHVITLQKTGNKIPRWLSEGISVYEERRTDPRWGQQMDADFRDRILAGNVTPISELSSAFLTAKSGEDMNFAYYESSMVVEHLITVHGPAALNAVLTDLNTGIQINDALDRHAGGLESLEQSFSSYLTEQARQFAPGMDFSTDALTAAEPTDSESVQKFLDDHPQNFPALLMQASLMMKEDQNEKAEAVLKKLIELVPENASVNGPRRLLAALYRETNRPEQEAAVLSDHLQRSADDLIAAMRLQELCETAKQPERVIELGQTIVGIDPFQIVALHRTLSAAETLQQTDIAVAQLRSLLQLQPDDSPRLHFRIAKFLSESDPAESRRHVLLALENAPRFRDAHQLLLQLANKQPTPVP
jgi:tetratricopeptide (TPR) repeat protein